MDGEALSAEERRKQLDALFWEFTNQLDLIQYRLAMQAEIAATIRFADRPEFKEVRSLLAERENVHQKRLAALEESRKLHELSPRTCDEEYDVH